MQANKEVTTFQFHNNSISCPYFIYYAPALTPGEARPRPCEGVPHACLLAAEQPPAGEGQTEKVDRTHLYVQVEAAWALRNLLIEEVMHEMLYLIVDITSHSVSSHSLVSG